MSTTADTGRWDLTLDEPGSAARRSAVLSGANAVVLFVGALVVVALGSTRLGALPSFTAGHATWVFVVDATTGWVLFLQFWSSRRPVYAVLGFAYLTDALLMPTFLLSFPGSLRAGGPIIGGSQSSIWVWHLWHLLFAATALGALLTADRFRRTAVKDRHVAAVVAVAAGAAVVLALGVTGAVTLLHEHLPVLIVPDRPHPLTTGFYVVATLLVVLTGAAMVAFWRRGWRRRAALDLWLAVALTAFFADSLANLSSSSRYTVGWYFGRVESVVASSILLVVFLSETSRVHRRLVAASAALAQANAGLVTAMQQKEELVIDLRRSEDEVRQLAFYDELTELPNRRLLMDRAGQAVAQCRRHGEALAVLFLDLDEFKDINDRLGHDVGDAVLKEVGARLLRCARSGDTVARVGGDEFVVLLAEVSHARDAGRVAQKVLRAMGEPVVVGAHRLQVGTSIGIALHPQDEADDFGRLLKDADIAMYAAKAAGKNLYRFYGDLTLSSNRPQAWA